MFPAELAKPLIKAKTAIEVNCVVKNIGIIKAQDAEKLIAIVQNRALGLNLNMPKIRTERSDETLHIDIKYPYSSTEKPFCAVKGNIKENGPEESRLMISTQGMKILR